ncbi:MAG: pilus assembly protein N-terminal domain-containing protein [Candidatus Rokubacteria bacterium]|nr:pilus assembly protein N-terminal domain-containing protein [Candidatus Rokubacteria bacterium]
MRSRLHGLAGQILVGLLTAIGLVGIAPGPGPAGEPLPTRLYLTVDKSHLIVLPGAAFTKVSVANPKIADVHVVTPHQLLVHGKAAGVTSLVVFSPRKVRQVDVVVQPAPTLAGREPIRSSEPHTVLVHRADRVTSHLFVRDDDQFWVELGSARTESDDPHAGRSAQGVTRR